MGQILKTPEPTIWALRKNRGKVADNNNINMLYEHLYGYDPIRVVANHIEDKHQETVRKGSAENPALNIINPQTNFMVMELASDEPTKA